MVHCRYLHWPIYGSKTLILVLRGLVIDVLKTVSINVCRSCKSQFKCVFFWLSFLVKLFSLPVNCPLV